MRLTAKQTELLGDPLIMLGEKDHRGRGEGLSARTRNGLETGGVHTVLDLLKCCPESAMDCTRGKYGRPCGNKHLQDIKNIGKRTLLEIFAALAQHGFIMEEHR